MTTGWAHQRNYSRPLVRHSWLLDINTPYLATCLCHGMCRVPRTQPSHTLSSDHLMSAGFSRLNVIECTNKMCSACISKHACTVGKHCYVGAWSLSHTTHKRSTARVISWIMMWSNICRQGVLYAERFAMIGNAMHASVFENMACKNMLMSDHASSMIWITIHVSLPSMCHSTCHLWMCHCLPWVKVPPGNQSTSICWLHAFRSWFQVWSGWFNQNHHFQIRIPSSACQPAYSGPYSIVIVLRKHVCVDNKVQAWASQPQSIYVWVQPRLGHHVGGNCCLLPI